MSEKKCLIIDSHVHFYPCFSADALLTAAYSHFSRQFVGQDGDNFIGILMLTESAWDHWFQDLVVNSKSTEQLDDSGWQIFPTMESSSVKAQNQAGESIYIIAGRQIVTKERLEVLALGTDSQFEDGKPMRDAINAIRSAGALAVIPWGFGKWSGARGEFLKRLLNEELGEGVFLGDSSGRMSLLPYPEHFNQAKGKNIKILSGTDPLPFASENKRSGSFGFMLQGILDDEKPAGSIKRLLLNKNNDLEGYGGMENPLRFLRNQVRMQIISRMRKRNPS